MALSNIGREPRREITESAVGIIVTVGWIYADYLISKGIDPYNVTKYAPPWELQIAFLMFLVGVGGPLLFFTLLYLTHAIGEMVCGWLKALRIDPRPRQRY